MVVERGGELLSGAADLLSCGGFCDAFPGGELPRALSAKVPLEPSAGYGYIVVNNAVHGLPEGLGSVIIGSPWVRPQGAYNPGGAAIPGIALPGVPGVNFNRTPNSLNVIVTAPTAVPP